MITIKPLTALDGDLLKQVITGYRADGRYAVRHSESAERIVFEMVYEPLPEPHFGRYDDDLDDMLAIYRDALPHGFCFGAYRADQLIGVLLAEPRYWNKSLWVWEFHVAEAARGLGVGRQLIDFVAQQAKAADLRTIVCETQNTNATAINVYRKLGFSAEAIDISYYSNSDYPNGEIAIFMKRRL